MATDALNLVQQLKQETGNLRTLADTVSKAELTKEFGSVLEEVISTLNSVNKDLCVGSSVFVQEYDDLINGAVANFITISNKLGGDIAEEAALLQQAFQAQRAFIAVVAESKTPTAAVLTELLKPTSEKMCEIQEYRDKRRSSKFFNHFSAISEGAPMLGWVTVPNTPAPYVNSMVCSATFYTNRILKEYRETDATHVDWTKGLVKVIQELEEYVKKHHLTGVSWNRQGKDASVPAAGAAPPPPAPAGGAPPPPPPPVVAPPSGPAAPASEDDSRGALFAALNQGEAVTSGLKKVTNDMKTHKNPELRKQVKPVSSSPKPYKAPAAVKSVAAAKPAQVKKPASTQLNMKRWDVEYHSQNQNIVLDEANMKQTVYIYKCDNSVINIPAKVNSITIDGCKKVGVACESVLGALDIVNCQSIKLQILGQAHIVNIDKTDGCMVYLSENCKGAEIISAKSSEMNVLVPNAEGEFTEFALPEQYRSVYSEEKKTMVTTSTESMG
ncbi:adenylyl cyclase-associated protein 1 [Strongylocentrotus purpuratus]|uniref:C-CAP/cofactor C-like domain-containing protein n=1 Tax=Strongylocentrotus purpuratus TaxID=7668 RepID=A0A7M7N1D0_STRPU|nr:adenylyl cyclase-associated protein 1 [Strongylocentrotus purpuratus]